MQRNTMLTLGLALATGASVAADRSIPIPPTIAMSWGYVIPGAQVNPHRRMAVGFWQRSSGAKPGVGAVFVSTIEYQLPEAAPARVRSATFQFSGRPSQCVGAEPVVIDVYAYAADGKSAASDASAGSRAAQLSADCSDKAAFARPIDVTAIVRQQAVAAGVRFVGFNIRKANNRQGPGLFDLSAGKLTVVLADQAQAQFPVAGARPQPQPPAGQPMLPATLPTAPFDGGAVAGMPPVAQAPIEGPKALLKILGALARNGADQAMREQIDATAVAATPQAYEQVATAAPRTVFVESFEGPATGNYTVLRAGQSFRTRNNVWAVEEASIDLVNTHVRRETVAFDGAQVVDLAGSPGPGAMTASFATTPGQAYMLVFHFSRNNGIGTTPARARVEVLGAAPLLMKEVQHEAARQPFNAYLQFRDTFRADSPSATLRFTSLNAGNYGLVIDAISVTTLAP